MEFREEKMSGISLENCVNEKNVLKELLIGARLYEIAYSDLFSLLFYKTYNISNAGGYLWKTKNMNLIIDSPFWVGTQLEWEQNMNLVNKSIAMKDEVLASRLVDLKYNNFVEVENVEFFEEYFCIYMNDQRIISISYYGNDNCEYPWVLEEYNDKDVHRKTLVICLGNEIIYKNC